MKNNKHPLTILEAVEKYKDQGLTVKIVRRLINQEVISSTKRNNKYYVSGHELKNYFESKDKKFSVKDKDRIKVLNDVENLRTKRLKNEQVISKIIEKEKESFFNAYSKIFGELPEIPHRLNLNNSQKTLWNEWVDSLTQKLNEEAQKVGALKNWEKIVDEAGVSREEILKESQEIN